MAIVRKIRKNIGGTEKTIYPVTVTSAVFDPDTGYTIKDEVRMVKSSATEAAKSAEKAEKALEASNQYVDTLRSAIASLPDGSAVSAQVAKNLANFGCEEFSTTGTYFAGMHCIYQGSIYKFTGTKQAGAWDASKAALSSIHELVRSNYVQKNDYVPGLTAGSALGLVGKGTGTSITVGTGGRTVPDTIGKGVSAKVTKIEGRSVAWRQMVSDRYKGEIELTGTGVFTYADYNISDSVPSGHKYFLFGNMSTNATRQTAIEPLNGRQGASSGAAYYDTSKGGGYQSVFSINTVVNEIDGFRVYSYNGTSTKTKNIILLDLTLTFGSAIADTITTVDDVANLLGFDSWQKYTESAQFATDMAYSENGELIPTRPQALRSEGVTATGETFSISRELSDAIAQAFPDGMRQAGSVSDSIEVSDGVVKAVKRIGVVDLGSLSWTPYGTNEIWNRTGYVKLQSANILNFEPKGSAAPTLNLLGLPDVGFSSEATYSGIDLYTNKYIYLSMPQSIVGSNSSSFISYLRTNKPKMFYELADSVKVETILPATSLDLALLSGGGTLTLVPQTGQRTAPLKATMNVSRDYVTLIEECAKKLNLWDA